jgi:hypothetical protein
LKKPTSFSVAAMSISLKQIILLCVLCAPVVRGGEMSEYKVKALFLYNFAQFIEWPALAFKDASAPITICVLEPNPFEDELEHAVWKKIVEGRPLVVRQITEPKQSTGCNMLFISSAQPRRVKALLGELKVGGLLTVGEVEGFASQGGVINFKIKDGSVRLEINKNAAEREGLHISSKLLSLAEIVK